MARALCAALFDGHGTGAAADRLNDSLYDEFSHAIDDQMLNTMEDLEPCDVEGASCGVMQSACTCACRQAWQGCAHAMQLCHDRDQLVGRSGHQQRAVLPIRIFRGAVAQLSVGGCEAPRLLGRQPPVTRGSCQSHTRPWVVDKAVILTPELYAAELPDKEDRIAGSTATVALVRRDKIVVANVGDSRAVLSRRGQAVDLSTEHRCACLLQLRGTLSVDHAAMIHNQRFIVHELSNMLQPYWPS